MFCSYPRDNPLQGTKEINLQQKWHNQKVSRIFPGGFFSYDIKAGLRNVSGYEYLMEKGSCLMFAVRQEIGFLDAGGKQEKMEHYSEINAGTDEKRI